MEDYQRKISHNIANTIDHITMTTSTMAGEINQIGHTIEEQNSLSTENANNLIKQRSNIITDLQRLTKILKEYDGINIIITQGDE